MMDSLLFGRLFRGPILILYLLFMVLFSISTMLLYYFAMMVFLPLTGVWPPLETVQRGSKDIFDDLVENFKI